MEVKEAYRLFWLVKGHLNSPHETIMASANGYFKRVWYDFAGEDMSIWEVGFEEEWERIMSFQAQKEIIYHLTCKVCKGYFTYATMNEHYDIERGHMYCPTCGLSGSAKLEESV